MSNSLEEVAGTVERLAVLLSAGVSPLAAWGYLDANDAVVERVARATDATEVVAALADESAAWRATAAAWSVATDAGAPLAPTLRQFARSLRTLAAVERDIQTALAGPRATTRLVMALPAVAVLFGAVLGFDSIGVLFTTMPGLACLAAGGALMTLAVGWNRRLLAAAAPRTVTRGLRLELVAVALSGGGALDRAVATVDTTMDALAITDPDPAVEAVIELSARAGVPAAELLRSEAQEARRSAAADAQRAAAVLEVKLMLPLGLCVLPAFVLVGVVPMLLAVLGSTVSGL